VPPKKKPVTQAGKLLAHMEAQEAQDKLDFAGRCSFRVFLESPDFINLALSPIVAAIADASEGLPVTTIADLLCKQVFNCGLDKLPREPRREVAISAGGRGGKTSRFMAPKAIHAAWTVPLRLPGAPIDPRYPNAQQTTPGEHPASIIIAPKRRLAKQCFSMVKGYIEASPILRSALVGEPTGESLTLRRPDGILVDIQVIVADKGGQSARSKSLVFCGVDEACFLSGAGSAVNDEDICAAARPRLVPGAQIWLVSTPNVEGEGVLENLITTDWGKHTNALVAARVGTRMLNPTWDPDHAIERAERARPGGNLNADREILAIPFPRGTSSYFPADAVAAACIRMAPETRVQEFGAGADLGHGHDFSALSIAARYADGKFALHLALEIPSGPDQKPSATYETFATTLNAHGCQSVGADNHYAATFREVLDTRGIAFVNAAAKDRVYDGVRTLLVEGRLALGSLEETERENVAEQLLSIVGKRLSGGRTQISAPRRKVSDMGIAMSGGHCDSVSALTLSLWRCGSLDPTNWIKRNDREDEDLAGDYTDEESGMLSIPMQHDPYRSMGRR
jgi:hypothetical protein